MRTYFKKFVSSKNVVTQGTIITNCVADNYDTPTCGVIITPRCDIANTGKVLHVHYLPIVNLSDWLRKEGKEYSLDKYKSSCYSKFVGKCKENSIPFLDDKDALKKMAVKIESEQERKKYLSALDSYFSSKDQTFDEYSMNTNDQKKLASKLANDELTSFQLIDDWTDSRNKKVILLRELKRIEYKVALKMSCGILKEEIAEIEKNDLYYENGVDEYESVAELDSPFVEYLMQRFSYNFCRIGIANVDLDDAIKKINNIIDSQKD